LPLFRSEVLAERSRPLWDQIVVRRSWGLNNLCLGVLGVFAIGSGLLLTVEYAPKIRVAGYLEAQGGTTDVVAQDGGIVTAVRVAENQHVTKGAALLALDHSRFVGGGQRATDLNANHLRGSLRRLEQAASVDDRHFQTARFKLQQRINHLIDEQQFVEDELTLATERWSLMRSTHTRIRELALKGTVSQLDWQSEHERLLAFEQSLNQLRRVQASAARRVVQLEQERSGVAQTQAHERLGRAERRAELLRDIEALNQRSRTTLVAPKAGIASFVQVKLGDSVAAGEVVLAIVGDRASASLYLLLGSNAVNDVHIGDAVQFRVLGTSQRRAQVGRAVVQDLSRTAQKTHKHSAWFPALGPTYRARAEISRLPPGISGDRELPVEARVLGERRSLWRWLVTPVWSALRGLV
jgi:multidrug resistance efflux pump